MSARRKTTLRGLRTASTPIRDTAVPQQTPTVGSGIAADQLDIETVIEL
jgi:hypothetical protein